MKYRDMLGFSKKQPKKKVVKEQLKPSVTDNLKEQFGPLNEWTEKHIGPKRWSGAYGRKDGLTEFEASGGKDFIKEGPAYEYANYVKKIEKAENQQAKAVNNFVKVLEKKGFKKEAKNVAYTYMGQMRKFNDYLKKLVDKLL